MQTEVTNQPDDQSWKRAYEVFERAMELPAGERLTFSQRTARDPEVLRLVVELLESEPDQDAQAPPRPQPGQTFGRFVIQDLLGRGGMGEVYSALDTELNRTVAMKFLSPGDIGSAGLVDQLVREARAASALNHPGIVTVHEVIRTDDSLAIVMELVDGVALRTMCGKPQPVAQAAKWGSQIAAALAVAHAAGVVHRDLKPENIIIRPDGYVKLLDFGVAIHVGSEDILAGIPIGTLGYMSPEQIGGKPLTGASDIFALGVVLTELVIGRHPFLKDTAALTTRAIQAADSQVLASGHSAVREPLRSLLREMLSRTPESRPTAAAVAGRLASISRESAASPWRRWAVPVLAALLISAAGARWWWRDSAAAHVSPRVLPLTSFEGLERNPTFSPDGNQIAFSWNGPQQNNWDIYVKSTRDDVPRRLTTSQEEDFNPVWSPDGSQIAFLRKTPGTEEPLILTVPAAGGPEHELTRTAPFILLLTHPIAWWPDGKSLIYRNGNSKEGYGLYRRFLNTGEDQRLTSPGPSHTDSQPLPIDGEHLALVRYEAGRKCAVCLAVSGKPTQCLEPVDPIDGMALASDRNSLLYAGESGLWRVPLRRDRLGAATRIADGAFPDLTADRQGKRFAFTKSYSDMNIWRIAPGARTAGKLIASSAEDTNADYSPDGNQVVFTSTRTGHSELYVAAKDGTAARQFTSLGGFVGNAQWSPDGNWIAFTALTDDTHFANVYVTSAAGGSAPRRITDDRDPALAPAWSRDGNWIYFSKGRISFWKIPWNGGTPVMVAKIGTRMDPRVSSDGQSIYYMGEVTKGGVRRLNLETGEDTLVPGTEHAIYRNWALGQTGIYFVEAGSPPQLRLLDFKTHRTTQLSTVPGSPTTKRRGLAVSPDESTLLYTSIDAEIGDIMLLEGVR
ncbi:MAG TPA: protein kinase [Candidatus Acidoferrales bacterium]|nr:protein kinase [Candidatus Acidoferrales bacterium]